MVFNCNGCQKMGFYLSAVAGTEDEEADKYYLIRAPQIKDHKCWTSSNQRSIRETKAEMYEIVLNEPTRSLQEIYEVVRQKYTAQMDSNTKLLFLQQFPRFLNLLCCQWEDRSFHQIPSSWQISTSTNQYFSTKRGRMWWRQIKYWQMDGGLSCSPPMTTWRF